MFARKAFGLISEIPATILAQNDLPAAGRLEAHRPGFQAKCEPTV
jgi:hypothetical protein